MITLGDFSAQVGIEVCWTSLEYTRYTSANNNGEKLCNLAAATNTFLTSTKFPHKEIRNITWMMPGTDRGNQIDYVLIRKRDNNCIQDTRSYIGANIDSDHVLVIAKCKIQLRAAGKSKSSKRLWDTQKLTQDEIKAMYERGIKINLEGNKCGNAEQQWKAIKESIIEAAEETIGYKKKATKKQ